MPDKLKLEAVPPNVLTILQSLFTNPLFKDYRLVGGTALALYCGHRLSVDLDLFTYAEEQPVDRIRQALETFGHLQSFAIESDGVIISSFVSDVKIDIVAYRYPWLEAFFVADSIKLASKRDIAAMKIAAIGQRGTKKDFFDLYELLKTLTLEEIIRAFRNKYKLENDLHYLQALTYFDDAEKSLEPKLLTLPPWNDIKRKLQDEVKKICLT